jgi:hypothetical protein
MTGASVTVWGYKNKKKNKDRRRERSSFSSFFQKTERKKVGEVR